MTGLTGKKILLGVTGGIAAYKSPDIVRKLVAAGADVQVVMTPAAQHFIGAAALQAVSGRRVRQDLWDEEAEAAMGHIELARWADLIVIAPATADCMANLAAGQAPDLLTTLVLASRAPLMIAPAMNQAMWRHAASEANCRSLAARGVTLLGPAEGEQACGDVGPGRMLEPVDIVERVVAHFQTPAKVKAKPLAGRHVLITAGPTREPIDPVRYISNRSSGKMGYALAAAAVAAGARVTLVSGPVALSAPAGAHCIYVETAEDMLRAVLGEAASADVFIGCAAVADYRPADVAAEKLKRKSESMTLSLKKAPDVLAAVAALEPRPFTVGFAAETQNVEANARGKLKAKGLDLIAANQVGETLGFDTDDNALLVIWPGGSERLGRADKDQLAVQLMDIIASRMGGGPRPVELAGSA